jgi:hypothetical protein
MSIVRIANLREQNEKKYQAVVTDIKNEMIRESIDIMRLGFFRLRRTSIISDIFLERLKKDYEATGEWTVEYNAFRKNTAYGEIHFKIVDHEKNDLFLTKQ